MIENVLAIARDPSHKDCLRANEFLAERMFGKPKEMAALEESENLERQVSLMSVERARQLMEGAN